MLHELTDIITNDAASPSVNPDKGPTIIFCDPGIDDALMLTNAFSEVKNPQACMVIPCGGNAPLEYTARNTLHICELTGHGNVPVYKGSDEELGSTEEYRKPLYKWGDVEAPYGKFGLGGYQFDLPRKNAEKKPGSDAAFAMILRHFREHPDQTITLISTAAMTDVYKTLARLEKEVPEGKRQALFSKLRLSVMGGVLDGQYCYRDTPIEYNMSLDPQAAQKTFELCSRYQIPIFLAPLDLTMTTTFGKDEASKMRSVDHPAAHAMASMTEDVQEWDKDRFTDRIAVHDLHASMCLKRPDLYQYKRDVVEVDDRGNMHAHASDSGNVYLLSMPEERHAAFIDAFVDGLKHLPPIRQTAPREPAAR